MGLRGPKPVDVRGLRTEAVQWAVFLYTLRDGQPGRIVHVKWNPQLKVSSGALSITKDDGVVQLGKIKGKIVARTSQVLKTIPIPVADAARELPPEMRTKDWVIFRPVSPAPEIWELLKRARSIREIREASRRIRKWLSQCRPDGHWWLPGEPIDIPDALDLYADKILSGKRLPNYAKTNRPRSDDKRIEFFSKILAGARVGIAPITAAKRLSRWHWPKDWYSREAEELRRISEGEQT